MAKTTTRRVLPVTVYSDYTCPWCYIGARRLEKLEEQLGDDVKLQVEWKPFEIHPEVPAEGMPVSDLPYPKEQWEMMMENLRKQAALEGLEMGNRPKVSNTHHALVASAYVQAEEPDAFEAFHKGLFRAYFTDGRDIGDATVVRDVAREGGVDVEQMEAALEAGTYETSLRQTTAEARQYGITGTPTYVFGGRYAAVGAQPTEALRQAVETTLAEMD